VLEGYIDDQLLWITDPALSEIRIMKKKELEEMDTEEVQKIFSHWHIVVEDQFEPTLNFDENSLRTLADLKKTVTLHG
jgi:hypothetical protein